ncbi:MAG TPA: hypothetical protein VE091_16320, partial [Gemmatimonadales bacterium]|nr:hypothetical protein [Gemmatimonadales bacterium]
MAEEKAEKTKEKAPKKDAPKKTAAAPAGGGRSKDKAAASATDPAPKASEGKPRLQVYYEETIRPRLQKAFGLGNRHQV